jgi:hypothetical protein
MPDYEHESPAVCKNAFLHRILFVNSVQKNNGVLFNGNNIRSKSAGNLFFCREKRRGG